MTPERADKEIEVAGWLIKRGYGRRASKEIAPIVVEYLCAQSQEQKFSLEDIKKQFEIYKKKELPDCGAPFHYDAEAAAGVEYFIKFLANQSKL